VGDPAGNDGDRLVVGIVEDLHLDPVGRPIEPCCRVDHTLRHVALVVDRQLYRDQGLVTPDRLGGRPLGEPRRADAEVDEVGAVGEQETAGDRDQDDCHEDHLRALTFQSSNNA